MKLFGEKIEGPNVEIVVIPRNGKDLVFKAQAVLDYTQFDALVPKPTPPKVLKRGNRIPTEDTNDKTFLEALKDYNTKRSNFIILESLRATEGLEWDTVKYDNPDTWANYNAELKASGFTNSEINFLIGGVATANSLDESKLEEARNRFLASQQSEVLYNGQSPKDENKNTPSGEPANASE